MFHDYTQLDKLHVRDKLAIGGTDITASADELNCLDGFKHNVYHLMNAVQFFCERIPRASINDGYVIIAPQSLTYQWQVLDVKFRAIGGAAGACTSIDLVEETSGAVVFSAPRASLTQNAWVTPDSANVVSTNLGVKSAVAKKLNLVVVGSDVTTLTHLDVVVLFAHWR